MMYKRGEKVKESIQEYMKKIFAIVTLFAMVFTVASTSVSASTTTETVYTSNIFGKDYKHELTHYDTDYHYMQKNLTGWIEKDLYANVELVYGESTTGTISYTITTTDTIGASVLEGAINASSSIEKSLGFEYSKTVMLNFKWTVTPQTPGTYHAIAINSVKHETKIDSYLQEFKWFGQGDYVYEETNRVRTPVMEYKARNYKYSATGTIYH